MDGAGHFPVLSVEVVELLANPQAETFVDCTVGLGGHAEALLDACDRASLIGIDLDESNLLKTKERLSRFGGRVRLFQANFADLDEVLSEAGVPSADGILADLGLATTQLAPERGFSFLADGPLDMRMRREGPTADDLLARTGERDLADLIFRYGEERHSRRIARAIVAARSEEPIRTTGRLARIVAGAMPRRAGRQRIHPATRTFQALRIAVNRELDSLEALLAEAPERLCPGGRMAAISFHSLEDRLIKRAFADRVAAGTHRHLTRKPRTPGPDELAANAPSRSAKLRAIERIR